ncbi:MULTISPECIES: hypothetical protein [unclassified Pseudomonas]|uniref:hypothetical protein n=1 Tax=unclassified Pseudomonas TaxID=196821 RepID=UPI002449F9DD|nr:MULTISPECIES: hypothetical protein [unclassified Pseudomonas]MDH0300968.1 hypothetical protein [Pseudomonas sp. GD04091]MDH1983500.1 hypothetical protein [Pseudomonas sp. GD03689]
MTTDRLSLLQFEHLSLSPAAVEQFSIALEALLRLSLSESITHHVAHYLGDLAEAQDARQLAEAVGLGIGFIWELRAAHTIKASQEKALLEVFRESRERAIALAERNASPRRP